MDKQPITKLQQENALVKINLKNGYFYQGHILKVDNSSIVFKDKFGNNIPISLDSISYILPIGVRDKNGRSR